MIARFQALQSIHSRWRRRHGRPYTRASAGGLFAPSIKSHTKGINRLNTPRFEIVIARKAPAALIRWYA